MKKIFAVIPIAILFVLLSSNKNVFAYTGTIIIYGDPSSSGCRCVQYDGNPIIVSDNDTLKIEDGDATFIGSANYPFGYESLQGYINYLNDNRISFGYSGVHPGYILLRTDTQVIYVYTGYIINNSDLDDDIIHNPNVPVPPPEPTWYESLFNDFIEYIGAGLSNGIEGFINWLKDAWTVPVGEGEEELSIDLITPPPPSPTPTPIPYQTVLQPDNNGGFQIQYIYPDPSGNPTSAPQPPNNTNITNNYGSDFKYPYYENHYNKDDPYVLDIPWYLRFIFKGQTTSLSDFQNGIDSTIETVNNSEEQIDTVMDSMSVIPTEWLLMIGFIGAIPLVGGIISRLLKG